MEDDIKLYERPKGKIREEILEITKLLTAEWFTEGVPEDTSNDLLFQDALCLIKEEKVVSFIIFTCWDGSIQITLMGTHPETRGKGYGSILINNFFQYVAQLGFDRVAALTVPPDQKRAYEDTLSFYLKNGFTITRRYTELWESGALELIRELK